MTRFRYIEDASRPSAESTAGFSTGGEISATYHTDPKLSPVDEHIVVNGNSVSTDNGKNFSNDRKEAQDQKLKVAAHIAGALGSVRNLQDTSRAAQAVGESHANMPR